MVGTLEASAENATTTATRKLLKQCGESQKVTLLRPYMKHTSICEVVRELPSNRPLNAVNSVRPKPPQEDPLPAEWQMAWDPGFQLVFYYTFDGQVQWHRPNITGATVASAKPTNKRLCTWLPRTREPTSPL